MAEKFRFFDSIDGEDERTYTADEFAEYFRQVISTGILNGGTNLQVVCSGMDMNVQIKEGYAWLQGYLYKIDTEPLNIAIDTADPVLDRVDRVVIRLDKRLEHRYVKAFILKGAPAEDPVAPALTRDENVFEISLAKINIQAGKSFIEQVQIVDERLVNSVCGISSSLIDLDTTQFLQQWNDWFSTKTTEFQNAWNDWFNDFAPGASGDFTAWFDPVKSQWESWFNQAKLDYNEAAYEANQILIAMGGF